MKAFLMYRDQDFDSKQVLALRDKENRGRRSDQAPSLAPLLPWNEKDLRQDLELDVLLNAMAQGDVFLLEVAHVALLSGTSDLATIFYRQDVYRDCAQHERAIREMYDIAVEAIQRERKNYWSGFARYPTGTLSRAVEVLQAFAALLKSLRAIADKYGPVVQSEGFRRLFAMLQHELSDNYFAKIDGHLERLRFRQGVLISAALGRGNKAKGYVLRRPHRDQRMWIERLLRRKPPGLSYRLHPRDEAGARALGEIRDQGVNLVANALAQSTDHILSFFEMLRTELAFYIGCLNLQKQLEALRMPVCLPTAAPLGTAVLSANELYDASLALSARRAVVSNDLAADGKQLIVITGANTGGKSTFMRSVGLAQMMMQAGMFVAAKAFSAEVRSGLCTHYKREEDATMESGKLDEELSRMSELVDRLTPHGLVLFNESFAATNEREGSQIAAHITTALLDRGIKVCFVTHLYQFANYLHGKRTPKALFLRADRRLDGKRTFRVVAGEPLQTSYGKDLYDRVFGAGATGPTSTPRARRPSESAAIGGSPTSRR
jgi:DNA mismatch repair ATPase MutS